MKSDVLRILADESRDGTSVGTEKKPSKETLNHPGLINLVSGLNVFENAPEAYRRAYRSLGIDIINRVPESNPPPPLAPGEIIRGHVYDETYLGVFNSVSRHSFPFRDPDELLERDAPFLFRYDDLITPVPHRLDLDEIARKEAIVGEIGLYYYQLYTTLFMWGVEVLGWEIFMTAALIDPERFDRVFLAPAFEQSKALVETLCKTSIPFVFLHDDLADANGPVFPPWWYDEFIFPRYRELFDQVKSTGKKVIFVADGNMQTFLGKLYDLGVDGVMLENPATPLDAMIDCFGDRIIIGGMETVVLTFGTPDDVGSMVKEVGRKTTSVKRFVISSPGGLHGNIPMENMIAYFDARVDLGATPENWRQGEYTE